VALSNVTIDAQLVRYLRKGVKHELSVSLEILSIEVDTGPDPILWRDTLKRFDEARALFEVVGLADEREPVDLELDLNRWQHVLPRLIESAYDVELRRLQDAAAEGFKLPMLDIPALRSLVEELREKVGAPPRKGRGRKERAQTFLERQLRHRRRTSDG
jgi:hypothetical protein